MSYYKKIISYLDYYEMENRRKNAGYVKLLVREENVTLEIQMKGLPQDISGFCEIRTADKENSFLGRFLIEKGTGYYNACYRASNMDQEERDLFTINGVKVIIDEARYCQTIWEWGDPPESRPRIWAELKTEVDAKEETEVEAETVSIPEKTGFVKEPVTDLKPEPVETVEEPVAIHMQERLPEDKWEQLCRKYPRCRPFREERDYLSISPADVVILRKEYQELVNNSFLLHGYYNYHHIILGKKQNKQEEIYYLGVPGAYYEREKKVAVMFGFEGFEISGQREKNEGAFGYYMRRVEL